MPTVLPNTPPPLAGTQNSAQDLISSAMRKLGATQAGETPQASELQDGLVLLNQMMDYFMADRLMIFAIQIQNFAIDGSVIPFKQTYTCGTGGDFNIPRPPRIEYVSIISLNNPAQPLELPMEQLDYHAWQYDVPVKNVSSALPIKVYEDGAMPFRNVNYWPIPSVAVQTNLYCWTPLLQFSDLVTPLLFPPAYAAMILWNLAKWLSPEYAPKGQAPETVQELAASTLSQVMSFNVPTTEITCDGALGGDGGHYDWRSDRVKA